MELETEWAEYPVLHLDLNTKKYENKSSLEAILNMHLEIWESKYGDEKKDRSSEERFMYVIRNAFEKTGKQVVILVDEYDKPLLQAIGNEALQDDYRNTLYWWTNMTSRCCRPSEMRLCRMTTETL